MSANRKEHLRYRYGICLNDGCSKCKSKEVQQIAARKDFVCEECQKPLRECPPPKSFWDKYGKPIIGAAVAVIAVVLFLVIMNQSSCKEQQTKDPDPIEKGEGGNGATGVTKTDPDSTKTEVDSTKTKVKETEKSGDSGRDKGGVKQPEPKASIQVPFGIYSGPASGIDGEIQVTRAYTLDLRNAAHESIELLPGDVITHTKFKNGELVSGYWQRGSKGRTFHR